MKTLYTLVAAQLNLLQIGMYSIGLSTFILNQVDAFCNVGHSFQLGTTPAESHTSPLLATQNKSIPSLISTNQFLAKIFTMDPLSFLKVHILQLTAITTLVTYGLARNKFTPGGVIAGISVSIIHMLHPWPAFFWLLTTFVFLGTMVTKVFFPFFVPQLRHATVTDR